MRAERWIERVHSRPYTFVSMVLLLAGAAFVTLWAFGQIAPQPSEVTVQRLRPEEERGLGGGPVVALSA
jgi:hypothetical protein